jgi:DNA-binding beta-propeller fold protein YncE
MMRFTSRTALTTLALAAAINAVPLDAQSPTPSLPTQDYLVFVASEATDQIALIRFGPSGARVERTSNIGIMQTDPDGPHGLGVAPNGRHYYVSTAHGTPFGRLWKYTTAGDTVVGQVTLGNFPASLQVSPDGLFAYVANFNLHGEMVPSSVSVVGVDDMVEVARIPTCTMPHGSRFSSDGRKHYSTCMMDEMLIEIDTRRFEVARHFMLTRGGEHGMAGAPKAHGSMMAGPPAPAASGGAGAAHSGHGMDPAPAANVTCSPTWAAPSPDGTRIYVACNKTSDVVEIDATTWSMVRRIPAGDGVYNLAPTHDGRRLITTNKRGKSISVIDLATAKELARIPTSRPVVHGVAISPDDRYAFISIEGVGSEPGTVDIVDLTALRTVASVNVGQMAGGIDFWKMQPAGSR